MRVSLGTIFELLFISDISLSLAQYAVYAPRTEPRAVDGKGRNSVFESSKILVGDTNTTTHAVSPNGGSGVHVDSKFVSSRGGATTTLKVDVSSKYKFTGARFSGDKGDKYYGVWEYPWSDHLDDDGIMFDLKGVGVSDGVNWINARAPFFISSAGYAVYAETLDMGSYDFTTPGEAQFIFNTSSLTYYIIYPRKKGDYKAIIQEYVSGLSEPVTMPPDSGYGPTFWSDDFTQDFHGDVKNAAENVFDVVNHLYDHKIHASSIFLDRPYGSGNMSWGNFDLNLTAYPDPEGFVKNLSRSGYDLQVWAANRAYLYTELYNASVANGWLFPGIDPVQFAGPALNLSIPAAYNYFKEHLRYFTSIGVKGFKIDRGEEGEMPVYEQNIQASLFDQLCWEVMTDAYGEHGFYTFTRNVVDKSRSKANVWNGDSHSNFSGLAYSVTSSLRAGLMGFSTWGSDTGGYIRGVNDPSEELWARWMWFSAFSTVYEIMVGTNHTPWYPPYSESLVGTLKETANLHHDLVPYIRSYTYQSSLTGIPVMRAAFLETPMDQKAWSLKDEYFFGSELLVAPIITSGGKRSVYFPKGAKYLEYLSKKSVYSGGSTTQVSLGVNSVPVYVKEGAIIPRGDVDKANDLWTKDWKPSLTIEVYPSWDVPKSESLYWNGKEQVKISVEVSKKSKTVKIAVDGDLGAEASYAIYHKSGCSEGTLTKTVQVSKIDSLF